MERIFLLTSSMQRSDAPYTKNQMLPKPQSNSLNRTVNRRFANRTDLIFRDTSESKKHGQYARFYKLRQVTLGASFE